MVIVYALLVLVLPRFPGASEAMLALATIALAGATWALFRSTERSANLTARLERISAIPPLELRQRGIERRATGFRLYLSLHNLSETLLATEVHVEFRWDNHGEIARNTAIGPKAAWQIEQDIGERPFEPFEVFVSYGGQLGGRRTLRHEWDAEHETPALEEIIVVEA